MAADEHPEDDGWVGQLTDRLEHFVDLLRNYSVRPALGIVRFLLVGAVASVVGVGVLVVVVIALTKLFDDDVFNGRVWATDLLFGGMFLAAGGFLFRLGARRKDSSNG